MIRVNLLDRTFDEIRKTCTKCFRLKPFADYQIRDGKPVSACKECTATRQIEWAKKNRERLSAKSHNYYLANQDRLRASSHAYVVTHKEAIREKQRAYYSANKDRLSAQNREWRNKNLEHQLFIKARDRAREFNVPFSITESDIVIPSVCPVLGIPITVGTGKYHHGSPSLDRLIPSLGYVPGNVAVISFRANWIKSNGTLEEHERIAKWMREVSQASPRNP